MQKNDGGKSATRAGTDGVTGADEEGGKEEGGRLAHRNMEERRSERAFKDTEEMPQWWSINQEGVDDFCKEWCETMEEKYKVEETKKGAYKGRGKPLERRSVKIVERDQHQNGVKTAGQESTHGSENTACSEAEACRQVKQKKKKKKR